jgi:hypothetical protein
MKRLVVLFLGCSLATAAYAEHFRLFGGPGFSRYDVKVSELNSYYDVGFTKSPKAGIFIGGGIEGPLTKHLFIELNAIYFSKGCHFDVFYFDEWNQETYPDREIGYGLSAISVPLLLKAKLMRESSPYILGGLECSYILAHKSEERRLNYWSTYPPDKDLWDEDVIERTSRLDFGLVLGGGFEIKIQKVFVFVEVRYLFGILNILTKERGYWLESIKTRSECVLIGIKI